MPELGAQTEASEQGGGPVLGQRGAVPGPGEQERAGGGGGGQAQEGAPHRSGEERPGY